MGLTNSAAEKENIIQRREAFNKQVIQEHGVLWKACDSFLIYQPEKKLTLVREEIGGSHFHNLEVFAVDRTRVASYRNKWLEQKEIVIRGTANWTNVFTDLMVLKAECYGVWFHNGFLKLAQLAFKQIQEEGILGEDFKKQGKSVAVTGHSLGGGVALVLAWILVNNGYNVGDVVTFGQPRVTSSDGCKIMEKKIKLYRVVNHSDVVVDVPKVNYDHFGEMVWLTESDKATRNDFINLFGISDHHMDKYVKEVEARCSFLNKNQREFTNDMLDVFSSETENPEEIKACVRKFQEVTETASLKATSIRKNPLEEVAN